MDIKCKYDKDKVCILGDWRCRNEQRKNVDENKSK